MILRVDLVNQMSGDQTQICEKRNQHARSALAKQELACVLHLDSAVAGTLVKTDVDRRSRSFWGFGSARR